MKTLFNDFKTVKVHKAGALIRGITTKQGVPTSCLVRVYNRNSGELLSVTTSKSDGSYVLFGSQRDPNYVIAIDPLSEYNLAAQDNVK
ncbi:MAG: hypothetical protein RSE38_09570 [Acinetobacter sp.]